MPRGVPKETNLVAKIIKALRVHSEGLGFFVKIHGGMFQASGLPDIIGCYKGRFVAFEVKLPGKEHNLTKIQADTLDELIRAGAIAYQISSVSEAVNALDDLDKR